MGGRIKKSLILTVVSLLMVIFFVLPVGADTVDQPDDIPTFTSISINQNLVEDGDAFVYGLYDLPYESVPGTAADEAYFFRLLEPGGTDIGDILPYTKYDSGYNLGITGFYFDAGSDFDWGTTYTIRIQQNPTVFSEPTYWDITIPASAYTSVTSQEDNQAELAGNLYTLGKLVATEYDVSFFVSTEGDEKLTDDGEGYFRGAIKNVQTMAPSLFLLQTIDIDTTSRTWTMTAFSDYANRFDNTWVGDAQDALGEETGMSGNMAMGFLVAGLCLGVIIFAAIKFRRTDVGYASSAYIIEFGVLMGWIPPSVFALIYMLFIMYIGYLLFYSRSSSMDHKLLSFLTFCWFCCTYICVIMEGSYYGGTNFNSTLLNQLSVYTYFSVGGIPIIVFNTDFFIGMMRLLLWDYSFFTGGFVIIRVLCILIFTPGVIWGIGQIVMYLWATIISLFKIPVTA